MHRTLNINTTPYSHLFDCCPLSYTFAGQQLNYPAVRTTTPFDLLRKGASHPNLRPGLVQVRQGPGTKQAPGHCHTKCHIYHLLSLSHLQYFIVVYK